MEDALKTALSLRFYVMEQYLWLEQYKKLERELNFI